MNIHSSFICKKSKAGNNLNTWSVGEGMNKQCILECSGILFDNKSGSNTAKVDGSSRQFCWVKVSKGAWYTAFFPTQNINIFITMKCTFLEIRWEGMSKRDYKGAWESSGSDGKDRHLDCDGGFHIPVHVNLYTLYLSSLAGKRRRKEERKNKKERRKQNLKQFWDIICTYCGSDLKQTFLIAP